MGTNSLAKLLQMPPRGHPSSLRRRSEPGRRGALARGNLQRHRAGRDWAAPPPPPPGLAKLPGTSGASLRTLESRHLSPPALSPPPLTGRSPVASSLRGPPRACGSRRTLGSRARRRGRARAVSAVRGEGWEFPAGTFSGFSGLLSSPNSRDGTFLPYVWHTLLALAHQEQKSMLMQKPGCIGLGCGLVGRVQGLPAPPRCVCRGTSFQTPWSLSGDGKRVLPGSPGR